MTAGVYMIVRTMIIFDSSPSGHGDRRHLSAESPPCLPPRSAWYKQTSSASLAYSTVSQLGYMFLGCGIGAYTACHLPPHDPCLLQGPLVPLLPGQSSMRSRVNKTFEDGGLSSKIPWTHRLFLIGTIAIAGIPPLAGFWSKDEILAHAFMHHHYLLYGMAAVGALLTSFYMFRLMYLTFYGRSRMDHHTEEHVHESPMVMVGLLNGVRCAVVFSVGSWGFPLNRVGSISFLNRS